MCAFQSYNLLANCSPFTGGSSSRLYFYPAVVFLSTCVSVHITAINHHIYGISQSSTLFFIFIRYMTPIDDILAFSHITVNNWERKASFCSAWFKLQVQGLDQSGTLKCLFTTTHPPTHHHTKLLKGFWA